MWTIVNPVILVEALSPSTAGVDHGVKLRAYFTLPSVVHYLIVDPEQRMVIHYKPSFGDVLETRILGRGALKLDPPGPEINAESRFGLD